MATRPVFAVGKRTLVRQIDVNFDWYPGLALSQKRKCIESLHKAARQYGVWSALEVSTKSQLVLGNSLSSFNLTVPVPNGGVVPLECAFQGSKVFERAGPFTDLFLREPAVAKRDPRLKESGRLTHFKLGDDTWELVPRTAFFDWLYLNALLMVPRAAKELDAWDAFTDIEFNPRKSLNTQARSCALFVALRREGQDVAELLADKERFLAIYAGRDGPREGTHGRLSLDL